MLTQSLLFAVKGIKANTTAFGRVTHFLETAEPLIVMAGVAFLVVLLVLALMGRRLELTFLMLMACSMSAVAIVWLDTGSTVARFILIGLLAVNAPRFLAVPKVPLAFFWLYVIIGASMTIFSPVITWTVQWAALLTGVGLVGIALTDYARDRKAITRLCIAFLLVAAVWGSVGSVTVGKLAKEDEGGQRFTGHTSNPGTFTQTGGILLPFAVWGAMRPWAKKWRFLCGMLAIGMAIVLIASAQRTGTFAGAIGCIPLLARRDARQLLVGLLVVGTVALLAYQLSSLNQRHTAFILKRYLDDDSSGRTTIWANAIEKLMQNPILGKGFGANKYFRRQLEHGTHNGYLSIWYDTGILGLLAFLAANAAAAWCAFTAILNARDVETSNLARLVLGVLICVGLCGATTQGAASPSDLSTCALLIMLVLSAQIAVIARDERLRPAVSPVVPWAYRRYPGALQPAARGAYFPAPAGRYAVMRAPRPPLRSS